MSVTLNRDVATATSAALLLVTVSAWVAVVVGPDGMMAGPVVYVATWTVMMVAMMLPSAAPLVLLYRRGATPFATARLTAGYLAVWAVAGVPAWVAQQLVPSSAGPFVLAAAGAFQLTPLKTACLKRCRSPADFLMRRWGVGPFRLGVEHGLWCLGCCWALMAVLVLAGGMGIEWVVGLAGVVALEKLMSRGESFARLTGVAFLVLAFLEVVR